MIDPYDLSQLVRDLLTLSASPAKQGNNWSFDMSLSFRHGRTFLATLCATSSMACFAAPATFFGEDPSANFVVAANSNSVGAKTAFLNSLSTAEGSRITESFSSFTRLNPGPLSILNGTATVSMNGTGGTGRTESLESQSGVTPGRFDTTTPGQGAGVWWQASGSFTISFAEGVYALGFYGTDFADFGGGLTIDLLIGGVVTDTVVVVQTPTTDTATPPATNDTVMAPNGSLLFFGFAGTTKYDSVRFSVAQARDFLGFDDLIVGQYAATNVPEPATLALVGLSLAGLAASRRRKAVGNA